MMFLDKQLKHSMVILVAFYVCDKGNHILLCYSVCIYILVSRTEPHLIDSFDFGFDDI